MGPRGGSQRVSFNTTKCVAFARFPWLKPYFVVLRACLQCNNTHDDIDTLLRIQLTKHCTDSIVLFTEFHSRCSMDLCGQDFQQDDKMPVDEQETAKGCNLGQLQLAHHLEDVASTHCDMFANTFLRTSAVRVAFFLNLNFKRSIFFFPCLVSSPPLSFVFSFSIQIRLLGSLSVFFWETDSDMLYLYPVDRLASGSGLDTVGGCHHLTRNLH